MRSTIRRVLRTDPRRMIAAVFLAATFGMMLILSLPAARFLPLRPPGGMLGLPVLLAPLRPFLPGTPGFPPSVVPARQAAGAAPASVPRLGLEVTGSPGPAVPGPEREAPKPSGPPGCRTRTTDRPRTAPRCGWEPRPDAKHGRQGPGAVRRPGGGPDRHVQGRDESKARWTVSGHGSKHGSKQDHGRGHAKGHEKHRKARKG